MKGLTKRQREIVNYIQEFIDAHHYSPSYREIMQYFGFSSLGTVSKHITTLKRKGFLIAERQCSRSVALNSNEIKESLSHEIEVPFLGHISEGFPIETFPQSQTLAVPRFLVRVPEKTYVLRVRGNTLNKEQIAEGDLILTEARFEALPGETVVALISQRNAVIKRYYPEGQHIRLEGNHSEIAPLLFRSEEVRIQGIVTGMVRIYL